MLPVEPLRFGVELDREARHDRPQLLLRNGLQQIVLHAEGERRFRVTELVVPAHDHHPDVGECVVDLARQREPVHYRHADVGDQHVGVELRDRLQGRLAVGCLADDFECRAVLGQLPGEVPPDEDLVLSDQN